MKKQIKRVARGLKRILGKSPVLASNNGVAYFQAQDALRDAKAHGQNLTEFIETQWGVVGAIDFTIEKMHDLGTLQTGGRVLELGPGTGNYLRPVKAAIQPQSYTIYETASDWRDYLCQSEGVAAPFANGLTLHETADESCDLVHAHGVFTTVPAIVSYSYLQEIVRVCAPRADVVFDLYPIESFKPEVWLDSPHTYAMFISKAQVREFLEERGLIFRAEFVKPWRPEPSTYLVFRKS